MIIDRVLSVNRLGWKLAAAVTVDIVALLVLRSDRVRTWCDALDGNIADLGGDE